MIILHKKMNDNDSEKLESKLEEMVISYKKNVYDDENDDAKLPFIEEDGKIISGEENIKNWLLNFEKELQWQRSLSGDGCYIDPESGSTC